MTIESFRHCFSNLPEATLLLSADGRVLETNGAARELLQRSGKLAEAALCDLVLDPPENVWRLMKLFGRSRALLPGALLFKNGGGQGLACRVEGGVFAASPEGSLLLVRLIAPEEATRRFRMLTEQVDALNGEVLERRRAEATLHAQQELLRATLISIGDAVIATDLQGNVSFLNGVAEALTGWTQEEASGLPLERICIITDEKTGLPVQEPAGNVLREGPTADLVRHAKLTAKDGRVLPIDNSVAPIQDAAGNIAGVVLVFRDMTERKQSEEALRRAVEFDEAVMNNMGEGLYTVDAQGLVTYMNPAATKLFGWSLEELRGRKMHDMTHHSHPDGTAFLSHDCPGLQVLTQGKNLVEHEDVFIQKDGTFFNVVYSSSPLRSGGEILGLVVVFRDISERKRLERALQTTEQIHRAIGESIDYGVWRCAPDGRNTYASDSFLQLVGITQEQCYDFGWGDVLHPDDAESTIAKWQECIRTGGPGISSTASAASTGGTTGYSRGAHRSAMRMELWSAGRGSIWTSTNSKQPRGVFGRMSRHYA